MFLFRFLKNETELFFLLNDVTTRQRCQVTLSRKYTHYECCTFTCTWASLECCISTCTVVYDPEYFLSDGLTVILSGPSLGDLSDKKRGKFGWFSHSNDTHGVYEYYTTHTHTHTHTRSVCQSKCRTWSGSLGDPVSVLFSTDFRSVQIYRVQIRNHLQYTQYSE